MRGNPLIRLALAIVVFLLLGIPVWNLTRGGNTPAPVPSVSADSAMRSVTLHVSFDMEEPASKIVLSLPGEPSLPGWTWQPAKAGSADWEVSLPKEGTDIQVEAVWPPDGKRHALKVVLSASGYNPVETTFWSGDTLRDVITLTAQN